jgi:outer membrane lipoprotein carrier protein LolA
MNAPRRLVAIAALALVAIDAPASRAEAPAPTDKPAPPAALDALFGAFGKSPGLYARFREEKQVALLVAPIKSEGTLHFERSKGLARHTNSPSKRSILLSGTTLLSWDGKKTETLDLKSQPSLRAVADSFGMLLAADRPGLERVFRLVLTGDPGAKWRLRLSPISADLKKFVQEIEVSGERLVLTTLRVTEGNGDVGTTTFFDVDTSKVYSAAEAAALFRVPPAGTSR